MSPFTNLSLRTVVPTALLALTLPAPRPAAAQSTDRLERAVANMEWRNIGPTIVGGRVSDFAVVESRPSTFYVGTATGGVWKTTNNGTDFTPVFDGQSTSSIGDVTVAPGNPNVVWVGTGEPQNRQSSPWGDGVYRSTDAGRSWKHMGLEDTHHISRIRIDPRNPDVVYVAAVGHLWGPNPDRGVFKTTDGGETWEKVLFVNDNTGAIDLIMDPGDPQTLFAAMYQRQRTTWGFNGGGPGSGIYRTTDGGATWEELHEGLPEGDMGRIGLDVYRGDGNLVFAVVEADARVPDQGFGGGGGGDSQSGVYRSTDRGETWEQVSTTNNRPMYYSQIRVDPNDPERIYLGGSNLYRSSDGGHTFTPDASSGVHSDHHALWIDPSNSDHLLLGGDGGVSTSWDRSDSWRQLRNLPIAQFYEVGVDMQEPYHVCGGLQDNGSWCAPSDTWSDQGIRTRDWYNVGGGDGFFTVMHAGDPRIMFAESQNGNIARVDRVTGEQQRMRPIGRPEAGEGEPELRWNWDTPVLPSATDPNTIYIGANVLFRSRDLGTTWEQISPDLTRDIDRSQLEIMGVKGTEPMMSPHDGTSSYGNLTALAESPLDGQVLYTGSDDGLVHVSRDGGESWTDVTANVPGLPDKTYVTRLLASRFDAGTVYGVFDGHRSDDFAPYVYVSRDYGASWRSIAAGLPATSVNAIAQHPRRADLLFVGNEVGIWFSVDDGAHWASLQTNLPTVPVDDILIHPRENDLVIGTHGRGIWIMDDIGPLEHLTADVVASAAHLFPVRRATSYNPYTPQEWSPGIFRLPNPPAGARIRYFMGGGGAMVTDDAAASGPSASTAAPADDDEVSIEILDSEGHTLRTLEGSSSPGIQEVIWDLRLEPPYTPEASNQGGGGGFRRGAPEGPKVLPGTYTVRMTAAGVTEEQPVEVRLDPRVDISRQDLMARQDAMMRSYGLAATAYNAGQAVQRLTGLLDGVDRVLRASGDAPQALRDDASALRSDLEDLGQRINDASDGTRVYGQIESVTAPPTADQLWQIEQSWAKLPGLVRELNAVVTTRMPALLGRVYQNGVVPDVGEPVSVPQGGGMD